jgi:hypothetical protein
VRYRFEIVSDYGGFRDLQRHRMLTCQWQRLGPDLGAGVPEEVREAGSGDDYQRALEISHAEFDRLESAGMPDAAPYALCLGYRIRYVLDLKSAFGTEPARSAGGFDGKKGWKAEGVARVALLDGKELDELKHSADFYDDLHDPTSYSSITVVGQNVFEGTECYELKLVRTTGFEYTEFFNVKTGLLAGMKMNATSQMGAIPVVQVVSEYKTFGGVLTPTVTHQRMMGLESEMTISSITFDPVDPKAFDLPPAIAALVKQQK